MLVCSGEIAVLDAPVFVGLGDIIAFLVLASPDDVVVLVGSDDVKAPPVLAGIDDVITPPVLVGIKDVIVSPDDDITPPVLVGIDDVIAPSSPDDVITPPMLVGPDDVITPPVLSILSGEFAMLRAPVLIGPGTVRPPPVLVGWSEVVLVSVFPSKHVSGKSSHSG